MVLISTIIRMASILTLSLAIAATARPSLRAPSSGKISLDVGAMKQRNEIEYEKTPAAMQGRWIPIRDKVIRKLDGLVSDSSPEPAAQTVAQVEAMKKQRNISANWEQARNKVLRYIRLGGPIDPSPELKAKVIADFRYIRGVSLTRDPNTLENTIASAQAQARKAIRISTLKSFDARSGRHNSFRASS
ncbi:hypothetical protein H4Q26_001102 [Puccinia striiformis f. sp. tritici PST-130]|nr:hypothetical protein Pst134EB_001681 [Puccinia striiformis f. sp. tritici]KAI9601288.1 hypothetical protein H4Q26_001102 [Puccinia striiformis f. sp. tritici PST-130]